MCQKGPFLKVFGIFKKIESLLLAGNALKRKYSSYSNFLRKPHVWEKSGSRDIGQKGKKWAGQLGESGPLVSVKHTSLIMFFEGRV